MSKVRNSSSLVDVLLPEAFQTEQSAALHCAREHERLGDVPAGVAMHAVSDHAKAALRDLRALTDARGKSGASAGTMVGRLFSTLRQLGTDLVVSSEKSYRGTLLGIHHGLDTFLLLEDAAVAAGDQGLADFCAAWLAERTRLVGEVERDLAWFAQNPDRAMQRATPSVVTMVTKALPKAARARAEA